MWILNGSLTSASIGLTPTKSALERLITMLIDPHVNPHTLSPSELIDQMIESSMDGAVITCTHSAIAAVPYIKALLDDEFICYVGVELRTYHGDLVFIPQTADETFFNAQWTPQRTQAEKSEQDELWEYQRLQEHLNQFEGVLIAVHPYSRLSTRSWGDRAFTLSSVDAVETRIGRGLPQRDYLCDQLADTKTWAKLGSSNGDCQFLGAAATVIHENVESQAQLCHAIRHALCWPIEFEDPMFPRGRYQGVQEDEGSRHRSFEERERREALDKVAHQRGYQVEEAVNQHRSGGRWGQKQTNASRSTSHQTQRQSKSNRSSNHKNHNLRQE